MNYITIATLLTFAMYTMISWMMLGPLESLSSSWYKWQARNFSAAWNIFAATVFLLSCYQWIYPYKESTKLLFVVSAFFMWALTVASPYKTYPFLHYLPTILSIAFGFACVYAEFGWGYKLWISLATFVAGSIIMKVIKVPYLLTWIELLSVVCIFEWFIRI